MSIGGMSKKGIQNVLQTCRRISVRPNFWESRLFASQQASRMYNWTISQFSTIGRMYLHSQRFSSVWTAWLIVLASLMIRHGGVVAQSNGTSVAAWEQSLVDAWATIDDCQPKTGMCAACGFGKRRHS
jgi:hypothetical protein